MLTLPTIPIPFASMEMRARVCMCIGVCSGIDSLALSKALGLTRHSLVSDYLTELVRGDYIGRCRSGNVITYHARKAGNKLARAELARLSAESMAVLESLKSSGRARLEDIASLESALLGE